MREGRQRIFIGNLPDNTNKEDLEETFANYGKIVSVEVKYKKDAATQDILSTFAFVNIETDDRNLNKCFRDVPYLNWNGHEIKLELAKESFLERLKREREETNKLPEQKKEPAPVQNNHTQISTSHLNKIKRYHSSSDSESEPQVSKKPKTKKLDNTPNTSINSEDIDADFVIKSNKDKIGITEIKIEQFNATPIHIIHAKTSKSTEKKDKKSQEADEKRKKSLTLMKNSYQQQKNAIRKSLSRIDTKPTKNNSSQETYSNDRNYQKNLFDEENDDGDNEINFDIKQQFEGKKGQKLLELQSRFTLDKRFTLDSRFAEEECENEFDENAQAEDNEKEKQLEILESVLGGKITKTSKVGVERSLANNMLRFDPEKFEHSKFEIKVDKITEIKKEKNKKLKYQTDELPVSKEQFQKVSDTLKESLQENQPFSLLELYGTADPKEKEINEVSTDIMHRKKTKGERNPFKYDSSDTEDDEDNNKKQKHKEVIEEPKTVKKRSIWHRNFFFRTDDERFQEGTELIEKFKSRESQEPFFEKRRKLRNIIRAKVRNVQKNNRPFRKKLGKVRKFAIRNARKKN